MTGILCGIGCWIVAVVAFLVGRMTAQPPQSKWIERGTSMIVMMLKLR